MDNFDSVKYEQAKNQANLFFERNRKLYSVALGTIYLNSEGFRHLIYKNEKLKHKRDWKNQIKRFQLLQYLKDILAGMKYYQEYCEELRPVKIKCNKSTSLENKIVRYWAFICVINNRIRVKFILKKIGEGNIIFWSVIPFWKTQNYKEITFALLHHGNPEED